MATPGGRAHFQKLPVLCGYLIIICVMFDQTCCIHISARHGHADSHVTDVRPAHQHQTAGLRTTEHLVHHRHVPHLLDVAVVFRDRHLQRDQTVSELQVQWIATLVGQVHAAVVPLPAEQIIPGGFRIIWRGSSRIVPWIVVAHVTIVTDSRGSGNFFRGQIQFGPHTLYTGIFVVPLFCMGFPCFINILLRRHAGFHSKSLCFSGKWHAFARVFTGFSTPSHAFCTDQPHQHHVNHHVTCRFTSGHTRIVYAR